MILLIQLWVKPEDYWTTHWAMTEQIKKSFDEAGNFHPISADGCAYGINKRKLNKNHLNDLVLWKVRGLFFLYGGFLGIELV